MEVQQQNALFQYFSDTLAAVIQEAKRNGRYDMGILGKMGVIPLSSNHVKNFRWTSVWRANSPLLSQISALVTRRWRRWTAGSSWHQATPHLDTLNSSPYVHISPYVHPRLSLSWMLPEVLCVSGGAGERGARDGLGGSHARLGGAEWSRWWILCSGMWYQLVFVSSSSLSVRSVLFTCR